VPPAFVPTVLQALAGYLAETPHLEFVLQVKWVAWWWGEQRVLGQGRAGLDLQPCMPTRVHASEGCTTGALRECWAGRGAVGRKPQNCCPARVRRNCCSIRETSAGFCLRDRSGGPVLAGCAPSLPGGLLSLTDPDQGTSRDGCGTYSPLCGLAAQCRLCATHASLVCATAALAPCMRVREWVCAT
jgi:hypothetical protein